MASYTQRWLTTDVYIFYIYWQTAHAVMHANITTVMKNYSYTKNYWMVQIFLQIQLSN